MSIRKRERRPHIELTPEDMKYPPMTGLGSLINGTPEPPRPTIEEQPDLYWTCETCGLIPPWWATPLKRWLRRSCPCKRKERERQEREEKYQTWLRAQEAICYGKWLNPDENDVVGRQLMLSYTFDKIAIYDPEAYEKAQEYAKHPDGNFILHGSYGTGKTVLGTAILNYRRSHFGNSTLFCTAPEFFRAYEEAKSNFDKSLYHSIVTRLVEADILYFDDIDKTWRGDWKQLELHEVYYDMFNKRLKAKKPTIVSTNKYNELERFIGPAALSRLRGKCTIVELIGEDMRSMEEWL